MLRFWITVSLLVTVIFAGIGLATSKAWGWSEYASDALYILYSQGDNGYFVLNTNANNQAEEIASKEAGVFSLACSPDGRTLAILTTDAHHSYPHLYVMTAAGLKYEKTWNENTLSDVLNAYSFFDFSVADDETVALSFPSPSSPTFINPIRDTFAVPPQPNGVYQVRTSPQGFQLWSNMSGSSQVLSPTGKTVWSLRDAFSFDWLAPGDILSFLKAERTSPGLRRYLFDATSHALFPLDERVENVRFSPDGAKVILTTRATQLQSRQTYIEDFPFDAVGRQLPDDPVNGTQMQPLCFLTFRPQMLIADNP